MTDRPPDDSTPPGRDRPLASLIHRVLRHIDATEDRAVQAAFRMILADLVTMVPGRRP